MKASTSVQAAQTKHQTIGINLMELLISLYADQEGVEITYELKEKDNEQDQHPRKTG